MSILSIGTSTCALCGTVIMEGTGVAQFPAFAWNDSDPLLVFNDASVHASCLSRDSRAAALHERLDELARRSGPGKRKCVVCGNEVRDPDDYIMLPHLGDGAISRFNYVHLHKSHVADWAEYEEAMALLARLSDTWTGPGLPQLIESLEQARRTRD